MPVPLRAKRGEMGKIAFQSYLSFMSFYIYIIFLYTSVSDTYVSIMYRCGTSTSNRLLKD
jgi:hypothetical protein